MTLLATVDRLRALPAPIALAAWRQLEAELGPEATASLLTEWRFWRRPSQRFPTAEELRVFPVVIFAGAKASYAAGKTRTAMEYLEALVLTGKARGPRIIAATGAAARELVEHKLTGLLSRRKPGVRYGWESSKGYEGELQINDVTISLMSVEAPKLALGSGVDVQFLDDPPKWGATGKAALVAALKSVREGGGLTILATTEDGLVLVADVLGVHVENIADAGVLVINVGSAQDNAGNLAPGYFTVRAGLARSGNLDPIASTSPWASVRFENLRLAMCPPLVEVAVSIDPSKGGSSRPCEVGIVGGGRDARDVLHVRHDRSAVLDGGSEGWPTVAWDLAEQLHAEHPGAPFPVFVFESNVGRVYGDLLFAEERARRKATVGVANNARCVVVPVKADRDKCVRADAPAAEAKRGRVKFAPSLQELEGQLRNLTPKGTDSDRADAANHLLTHVGKLAEGKEQVELVQAATAARAGLRSLIEANRDAPRYDGFDLERA